jgi:hypothetical protein
LKKEECEEEVGDLQEEREEVEGGGEDGDDERRENRRISEKKEHEFHPATFHGEGYEDQDEDLN